MKINRAKSRIVESIQAAAALLEVPVDVVKKCKRLGCPAFTPGNRIDVDALKKWISEHEAELRVEGSSLSLKDQKTNEEIRKLRIKNDRDEKLVVPKDKGMAAIANCIARVRPFLEQKLENEYPSVVVGMNDVAQVRVYGRKIHDQILQHLQTFKDEWEKI